MLKLGQRWLYTDSSYTWIVEVVSVYPNPFTGRIIQVIRDRWLEIDGHTSYPVGSKTLMQGAEDGRKYWQYLEGQDKPKEEVDGSC